jgi:DNA-binding NarL/FixJ family response regulator
MTAPPRPTVRDAAIAALLDKGLPAERVAAVGVYRRSWTAADVAEVVAWRDRLEVEEEPAPVSYRWEPPRDAQGRREVVVTPRMADVLGGICRGLRARQIADELGLAEETVKTHMQKLYARLGVRDRAHAAALAWQVAVTVRKDNARRAER